MSFIADKQTLKDLNIPGKFKNDSVFNLFNQVHTLGGERLLEAMFQQPLTDYEEINKRSNIFRYFQEKQLDFPINGQLFEQAENYLSGSIKANPIAAILNSLIKKILSSLIKDPEYQIIRTGVLITIDVLNTCKNFFDKLKTDDYNPFDLQVRQVNQIFDDERFVWIDQNINFNKLSFFKLSQYDYLLRSVLKNELKQIIVIIHQLDVYTAVGKVALENNYTYAKALPKEKHLFNANALRHPLLKKAVGNTVSLSQVQNVIFLTGANMAGKSTLMKTLGISFHLAHMGFPIAADNLIFSVKEGLYSSINTPDDLNMGYSHFYAEVLRVKKVAEEVAAGKNMMVIFDELFKGTNVKDAYDATLAVTEAFAHYTNCFFIISTHIIEVGELLKSKLKNLQFKYLPTILEDNRPRYTYQMVDGITSDRQGMIIIENEGLLELLNNGERITQTPP